MLDNNRSSKNLEIALNKVNEINFELKLLKIVKSTKNFKKRGGKLADRLQV